MPQDDPPQRPRKKSVAPAARKGKARARRKRAARTPHEAVALLDGHQPDGDAWADAVRTAGSVRALVISVLADSGVLDAVHSFRAAVAKPTEIMRAENVGPVGKDALAEMLRLSVTTMFRHQMEAVLESVLTALKASNGALSLKSKAGSVTYRSPLPDDKDANWPAIAAVVSRFTRRKSAAVYSPDQDTREIVLALSATVEEAPTKFFNLRIRCVFDDVITEVAERAFGRLDVRRQEAGPSPTFPTFAKYISDAHTSARRVMTETNPEVMPVTIPKSLDPDTAGEIKYIEDVCALAKLAPDLVDRFVRILQRRATLGPALSVNITDVREPAQEYVRIAAELSELQRAVGHIMADSKSSAGQVYFLLRLEEAVCRVLSSDTAELQIALTIFRELQPKFGDRPTMWFRFGQAQARLAAEAPLELLEMQARKSARCYEEAEKRLRAASTLPADKRLLVLSEGQAVYLRRNIGRLRSFVLWRAAERFRDQPTWGAISFIGDASKIIDEAIKQEDRDGERWKLVNNAISYAAYGIEMHQRLNGEEWPTSIPTPEKLRKHIDWLAAQPESNDPKNLQVWDSMAHARHVLKEPALAQQAASKFLALYAERNRQANISTRSSYERIALKRALDRVISLTQQPDQNSPKS